MPPNQPRHKFSLATAILAELEMDEQRRPDDGERGEAAHEPSPRSGVRFRGEPIDAESESDLLELDEAELIEPLERREPTSVRPSREPEAQPGVERAMLLGRAPLGSPRMPEVRTESIDLESLMRASRSSRPPALEPEPVWTFLPVGAEAHPAQVREVVDEVLAEDRGDRSLLGKRIGVGLAVALAVAGAFYAGAIFSGRRSAASDFAAAVDVDTAREHARENEAVAAPAIATAPSSEPSVAARIERGVTQRGRAGDRVETSSRASSAVADPPADPSIPAPEAGEAALVAPAPEALAAAEASAVEVAEPGSAAVAEEVAPVELALAAAPTELMDPALASAASAPVAEPAAAAPAAEVAPAPAAAAPAQAVAAAPAGPLPALPSRSDIRRALSGVTPALRSCTDFRGTAMMSITIAGSGDVISATPAGSWAGATNRTCLREAVGRAHLPRFQQERLTVQFPFVL